MSEQEREGRFSGSPEEETEVEGHMPRSRGFRGEGEPPANVGEQTEERASEGEGDVEGHMPRITRGASEGEPPPNAGE